MSQRWSQVAIQMTSEDIPRRPVGSKKDPREMNESPPKRGTADIAAPKAHGMVFPGSAFNGTAMEDMIAAMSPVSGLTFPLQVSSLLDSTSLPHHKNQELVDFLDTLRTHLLAIPPVQSISLDISRKRLQELGIALPLENPEEIVQWSFAFKAPQDIKVMGSWIMQTGVKISKGKGRCNCVDLLVEMPSEILQERDYLSHRYFHKRAHYLACLAASLSASTFAADFEISYFNLRNEISKPVLVLKPKGARSSSTFKPLIRLIPSYPDRLFPAAKLSPKRANLKPSPEASPRYNQSVLLDSTAVHFSHLSYFTDLSTTYPTFTKTCILLKIWAKQRGFYHPAGGGFSGYPLLFGFENFGWLNNFIVAHVLVGGGTEGGKKKSTSASVVGTDAVILFLHVIDWIAQWNINSVVRMNTMGNFVQTPDEFQFDNAESALIDPTGQINLIANFPPGSLQLLRQSAIHSSALLHSGYDKFDSLFLRPQLSFSCYFDYHFMVSLSIRDIKRLCKASEQTSTADAIHLISKTLNQACGNRLLGFGFLTSISHVSKSVEFQSNAPTSSTKTIVPLKLGVILDPQNAFNVITHGPSPDTLPTEAAVFREFWGGKCDLRRFQDGTIEECVSWDVSDPLERLRIIQQIIRWVIVEKLQFANSKQILSDFVGVFDDLIVEDTYYVQKIYDKDPKCLGFTNVMKCFNEFAKELKDLNKDNSLPLAITSVQASSEHLRYSSVFVPGPRKIKGYKYQPNASKYLPGMSCQLKFESSGKWPEDLEAIQKIKAALLAKISEKLSKNRQVARCQIVFDHDALPISDNVALEVLHSSGYCFVLSVYYEREEMLLENALGDGKPPGQSECETIMTLEALTSYRRKFIKLRKHHDAITALQARFPSFSYTVRIIKRWLASHLLSSQISSEMVELLSSAVYLILQNDQLAPTTGSTGFLRFLKLMKEWKWREKPLLIPLQSSIGLQSTTLTHFPVNLVRPAITNFASIRKRDPGFHHLTYFVATEEDLEGTDWMWTNSRPKLVAINQVQPHRVIADRIQALAAASLTTIEFNLEQNISEFNVRAIFKSPAQDYDFHLVLDLAAMTRIHQSFDRQICDNVDPLGLPAQIEDDPISHLVTELQRLHGDTVMFFYDALGGATIAGIFNPLFLQPKTIKTHNRDYLTKPASNHPSKKSTNASSKVTVVMDTEATLYDIQRFGEGVVHHVLRKGVDY